MGVFDDKKFEELDWISQATEPIDSQLNDVLAKLPDEVEITFDMYTEFLQHSYNFDLSVDRVISYLANKHGIHLTWNNRSVITDLFKFEIEGSELELDFETRELRGGSIRMVKLATTMDEKVLEGLLGKEGCDSVSNMHMVPDSISRCNDIMELLGDCKDGLKTRSTYKKRTLLTRRLKKLFKDNEWKIKDTELANKVGIWIRNYVQDGDAAAYANFCRLKVMTHKDQPIYSMEEIK